MEQYITFVTDVQPGEPDFLRPLVNEPLVIRCGEKELKRIDAPPAGWTHELLCEHDEVETDDMADAYLGEEWIGSTEV